MELTRREVMRVAGYSALFSLLPLGMQSAIREKIEKEEIPGSGNLDFEYLEKIDVEAYLASCSRCGVCDVEAYLASCSRCGVCVSVCPQQAIKLSSFLIPVLTPDTRDRCPSTLECSVCMRYCPTNAIINAYDEIDFKETALYKRQERLREISKEQ